MELPIVRRHILDWRVWCQISLSFPFIYWLLLCPYLNLGIAAFTKSCVLHPGSSLEPRIWYSGLDHILPSLILFTTSNAYALISLSVLVLTTNRMASIALVRYSPFPNALLLGVYSYLLYLQPQLWVFRFVLLLTWVVYDMHKKIKVVICNTWIVLKLVRLLCAIRSPTTPKFLEC